MLDRYDHNLILDYIEDELSPSERAGFEQLLVQDRDLQVLVDGMLADRRMLREMPLEKAPREVLERVQQRMERNMLLDAVPQHTEDMAVVRRFRLGRVIAYGSLAAMLLVSALLMYRTLAPWNGQTSIEQLAMQKAQTGEGAARRDRSAEQGDSIAAAPPAGATMQAADAVAEKEAADDSPALARTMEGGASTQPEAAALMPPAAEALVRGEQATVPTPEPRPPAIPVGQSYYALLGPAVDVPGPAADAEHREQVAIAGVVREAQKFARNRQVEGHVPYGLAGQTQALRVQTSDAAAAQAALQGWCVANGVTFVEASGNEQPIAPAVGNNAAGASRTDLPDGDAATAVRSAQAFVLLVRPDQLPDLVDELQGHDEADIRVSVTNGALPGSLAFARQEPAQGSSGAIPGSPVRRQPPELPRPAQSRAMPSLPERVRDATSRPMRSRASAPPPLGPVEPAARSPQQRLEDDIAPPAEQATGETVGAAAEPWSRRWGMLLLPQLPLSATLPLDSDVAQPLRVRIELTTAGAPDRDNAEPAGKADTADLTPATESPQD